MSLLALVRVDGIPGPKGSLNAFCPTCARKKLPQRVVVKEQSDVGVTFRRAVSRQVKKLLVQDRVNEIYAGDIETRLIFFIHRQKRVKAGVELEEWVPSHSGPRPTFQKSGDVEKHARTVHDALMDAGLIVDDSQVWRTTAEKRWADAANPPGCVVEVRTADTFIAAGPGPAML
jgi:Holliday junction resolvase RusA-like endonuclease